MPGDDERPIRPASHLLLRAFAGETIETESNPYAFQGYEDEDDAYARQAFEHALLGITTEAGVDGGVEADFANVEGLHDMGVTELLGRTGSSLSEEILSLIPCTSYDGRVGIECPVCIAVMECGQGATCLPCGHLFHHECILRWFQKEDRCPCCRQRVTKQTLCGEGVDNTLTENRA